MIARLSLVFLCLLLNKAYAADLRGSFAGLTGASIHVTCGDVVRSTKLSQNGKFRISNLPANKACFFTVRHGQSLSVPASFSTNKNITNYKGTLRKVGNKIIVIRK